MSSESVRRADATRDGGIGFVDVTLDSGTGVAAATLEDGAGVVDATLDGGNGFVDVTIVSDLVTTGSTMMSVPVVGCVR